MYTHNTWLTYAKKSLENLDKRKDSGVPVQAPWVMWNTNEKAMLSHAQENTRVLWFVFKPCFGRASLLYLLFLIPKEWFFVREGGWGSALDFEFLVYIFRKYYLILLVLTKNGSLSSKLKCHTTSFCFSIECSYYLYT